MADETKKGSALPIAADVSNSDTLFGIKGGVTSQFRPAVLSAFVIASMGVQVVNATAAPFLAKLDGITDDSAALQAAINATPVGGTLVIPGSDAGCIATGLVVNKRITIASSGTVIKQRGMSDAPTLSVLSVKGFQLTGVSFNGNKASQTIQTNVLELKSCSNFRITDVDIDLASYCAVRLESNTDTHPSRSVLRRVSGTRSGYSGLQMFAATRLDIIECNFSDNAGYGAFYDSSVSNAGSDVNITGGNYDYNGYTGIFFPYFNYTALIGKCGRATVKGASASYNTENGITLQGRDKSVVGGSTISNGITGTLVNGTRGSAIGVESKYNGSVGFDFGDCEDMVCTGNTAIENGDMGIEINSCLRFVVSGNVVNGNNIRVNGLKAGIVLQLGTGGYPFAGPSSGGSVTGNFIGPGPNQDFGILLTADTSDNVVEGNACVGSGLVQDIRSVSGFNTVKPGASRAGQRGGASEITTPSAATVTIMDAAEVIFLTGTTNISTITGGNLSAGRQITLVFNSSTPQILTTGNILSGLTVSAYRPLRLTYIKSLEKWAIDETKTF